MFTEANPDALTELVETAKIQSTEAANKIEGILTSDERLRMIVMDKTVPKRRNEEKLRVIEMCLIRYTKTLNIYRFSSL